MGAFIRLGLNGGSSLGGQELAKLAALTNGLLGIINSAEQFRINSLPKATLNKIALNIQKGLKANGERALTSEIKASIKAGFKSTNVKLGVASVLITGVNIAINGEVRPSDIVNLGMTAISFTPLAPLAPAYFIADVAFGISDSIDERGPHYKIY